MMDADAMEMREARSSFRENLEALLEQLDSIEDGELREVVTSWAVVVETAQLNGNRTCRLVSGDSTDISSAPLWELTGLIGWAQRALDGQYMEIAQHHIRRHKEEDE